MARPSLTTPGPRLSGNGCAYIGVNLVGTSLLIGVFFVAYLHLLHHPSYPVTVMTSTALDRFIPFQPQALFLYLSLWLYVGVGPGLQLSFLELVNYAAWAAMLCVVGLVIFEFFGPPRSPRSLWTSPPSLVLRCCRGSNAAGNACPSMHVAFSSFTSIRVDSVLRSTGAPKFMRTANMAWSLAIAFSTLAIKQHVVLDVVAGLVLGTIFAALSLRWGLAIPKRLVASPRRDVASRRARSAGAKSMPN